MYDEPNDEHDFWGGQTWTTRRTPTEHHDEPTRQLRRVDPRERRAEVPVAQRPALLSRSNAEGTGRFRLPDRLFGRNLRTVDGRIDPFLARLGMIVLAVVLLVPVAVSLRPEHKSILRSAPTGGATAIPDAPLFDDAEPATDPAVTAAAVIVADTVAASSEPAATVPAATDAPTTAAAAVPAEQRTEAAPTATTVKKSTPVTQPPVEKVATTNSCATKYTIVAGDSWIGIARRAGVTTKALLAANNAKATTAIYPGRTVCLPAGATQPPVTTKPVTTTTAKPATTTTAKPKTTPTTAKPVTTTTAKPATTTTKAPVVVPTRTYSRAEVEAIIREVWPDELEDKAVAIAKRESNLIPTARNSCCLGLFQIYYSVHKTWLAAMGITSSSQLFDPRANAYAALVLYNRAGGWGPWGG